MYFVPRSPAIIIIHGYAVLYCVQSPVVPCSNPFKAMMTADSLSPFETKDQIRHRLRLSLKETTARQKNRLLYGLVGVPVKGFHCRTREELLSVDGFLRAHFPEHMKAGAAIPYTDMESKLQELDGGLSTEEAPAYPRSGTTAWPAHSSRCDRWVVPL